jgi:hypothetical protein
MSQSISTLLIRNLDDVFGEGDPRRRRAAIDEIFTEDAVFYEPGAVHRGRDEIAPDLPLHADRRAAGAAQRGPRPLGIWPTGRSTRLCRRRFHHRPRWQSRRALPLLRPRSRLKF